MAEQTSPFQNKKLLLAALLLGVLAVILMSWQDLLESRRAAANTVEIVRVTQDLQAGQTLTAQNTEPVSAPREIVENMPGLVRHDENFENGLGVEQVLRSVNKGAYLQLSDLGVAGGEESLSDQIEDAVYRVVSVEVDPRAVPALFISRGDRVDLYGRIGLEAAGPRRLLIEAVKVVGVGNQPDVQGGRNSFRSLQIQLPADIVPEWMRLEARLAEPVVPAGRKRGRVRRQEIEHPYNPQDLEMGGRIVPEVLETLRSDNGYGRSPDFGDDGSSDWGSDQSGF